VNEKGARIWVRELSDMVNIMGSSKRRAEAIVEEMYSCHRTLQQGIVDLFLQVLLAYKPSNFDLRNEAAVKLCEQLRESLGDIRLPTI
jgi:hypothetical protein